jgi:LuxR family maltose regulon positive regulatory protein
MASHQPSASTPHLQRALDQLSRLGVTHRLVLVTAPADSLRSAVLGRWAQVDKRPFVWVSLRPEHNQEARFLTDLGRAVSKVNAYMGEAFLEHLGQNGEVQAQAAVIEFINTASRIGIDFVLVLDAYQNIHSPAVHTAVQQLLDYPPPNMLLVISTRQEPPLELPRLRVRRQLLEIDLEDELRT